MRRIALALAFVAGLAFLLVATLASFDLDLSESLRLITQGAFGDKFGISRTLVRTTPLLLAGLGVLVAWRAGMFNIGGEGQYVSGGVVAAWAATGVTALGAVSAPILLLASAVGGAIPGALAGWLAIRRGVNIVISTILMNFIALQALDWAVRGPIQESKRQVPLTERLPDYAVLPRFDPQTDLHAGILIAPAVAVLVWLWLYRTRSGIALRFAGENPRAARTAGLNPNRSQLSAMAISGGLCGLAGGVDYVGFLGQIGNGFSQNWGFMAIPVALLGGLHPLGVMASALYFGALFAGCENLARYQPVAATVVFVIQGVAVLAFVAGARIWERTRLREEPA